MQVILLERVESLGQMGDVVKVKPGHARNYLLPQNKALRATKENIAYFDGQKKHLEAENAKKKVDAEKLLKKVDGLTVALIRQASEAGSLYGSVTARDIALAIADKGHKVDRAMVRMEQNYKTLGLYPVKVWLHPEVMATVTINIARSAEEAKLQEERGEALVSKNAEDEAKEEQAKLDAAQKADAEAAATEEEAA